MSVAEQIAKMVINKDYGYNLDNLKDVNNAIGKLPKKIQGGVLKRAKALMKHLALVPPLSWWEGIIGELREINKMVESASRSIYPNGAGDEYYFAISCELAGYQITNIRKICDHVVKTYDEPKALPTLSFWLKCVTAVKSQQPSKNSYAPPLKSQISKEEQAEVKDMMKELCESFGVKSTKEGAFHNKTTLIRCYGILQYLNKGMRQVQTLDGKDYEWVNEWEVGGRVVIDHSKVLELFNSGRISEKEAKKVWEKEKG